MKDQQLRHRNRHHSISATVVVAELNEHCLRIERFNDRSNLAASEILRRTGG
jgi:hypothetical protein